MPKKWDVSGMQSPGSVFNLPASQYPSAIQDRFDSLLDEFDELRQKKTAVTVAGFLESRLKSGAGGKVEMRHYQLLVKQLIEIDICYRLADASPADRMEDANSDEYVCFGKWAVDHAQVQRVVLLESLHGRRGGAFLEEPGHQNEFIFKPTFASGRFAVHEQLGSGGMGAVFRVCEKSSSNEYALKTIKTRCPSLLYRLKQEFRSLIAMEAHPNVILPHELFVDGGDAAFTMELVSGVDFVSACENLVAGHRQPNREFVGLFIQLADALLHVHHHGLVHRDIKPGNVLVTEDKRVVLLDFGLVDDWSLNNHQRDEVEHQGLMGTIGYLSPEQADGGSLDPASDWFSFGVLLYRCLTGKLPHGGDSIDEIIAQKKQGVVFSIGNKQSPACLVNEGEALMQLAVECLRPTPPNRPCYEEIARVLTTAVLKAAHPNEVGERLGRTKDLTAKPLVFPLTQGHVFVGRETEIECFEEFSRNCLGPRLIEVVGDSGIGKTGFLNRVLGQNVSDWVIRSRCFYQEKTRFPGIDPIVDQLAAQICCWPERESSSVLPQDASPLFSLFPTLAQIRSPQLQGPFFELDTDLSQRRIERAATAFVELIENLSEKQHLFLVIDDFQWANQGSADLLAKLINGCKRSTPLTIVLACRPPQAERETFGLLDVPHAQRISIRLPKFSTNDGIALFKAIDADQQQASHWAAERREFVEHLVSQASGSPLHLWEFAYQLSRGDDPCEIKSLDYQSLLRKRLAQLTPEQFKLLKVICASDLPFDIKLVARFVLGDSGGGIEKLLRHLEQEKLLTRSSNSDELEVFHGQISKCVREVVGEEAMQALHLSIAGFAEQQSPESYRLISEQYQACGLRLNAVRTLVSAAQSARVRQCFEEAIFLLQQSIAIANLEQKGVDLRNEANISLAETLANAGRCKQAAELFLQLAEMQPPLPEAASLRRKAIFQHIFADQTNVDLKTTNQIASPLGIKFSANPVVAMLSVVFYRMAYSLVSWRGRDTSRRLQQRELIAIVARALTLTNPLLASSLAAKLVYLCRRFGTKEELEDALDLESFLFKAVDTGKPFNLFGETIVSNHLGKRLVSEDPRQRTAALLSKAVAAYTNERLIESLALNDQALEACRLRVDQSNWELEVLAAFRIWAYHYTGNFNAFPKMLNSRAELLSIGTEQAASDSDHAVPRQILQRLPGYFETYVANALLRDDVSTAREAVAQVEDLISGKNYSGRQHEFAFAKHYYLMYVGEFTEALRNVLYQKKMIWRIGYQLVPVITPQLLAYEIVIRTALAFQEPSTLEHHRRVLRKISRQLSRRQTSVRRGLIASIGAFEASCKFDNCQFETEVGKAIEGFEESGFFSLSYLLRFAAGEHEQTEKQVIWKRQANVWATERGIAKLKKISRIAAPTFRHIQPVTSSY